MENTVNDLKLLRIRCLNLALFHDPFEVDFTCKQKTGSKEEGVFHLNSRISINTVLAVIGKNASGKTLAVNTAAFALLLLSAEPLNKHKNLILMAKTGPAVFEIDFYHAGKFYLLVTALELHEERLRITEESLYENPIKKNTAKKNLFNHSNLKKIDCRDHADFYLADDISLMIAFHKKHGSKPLLLHSKQDFYFDNPSKERAEVPAEILHLFDPQIERMTFTARDECKGELKFYHRDPLPFFNADDLKVLLSFGTIKGLALFLQVERVLKNGGYLLADDVETSLPNALLQLLLDLFLSPAVNYKGAVLLFTTHYAEILDHLERKDAVYFTRKAEGLEIIRLAEVLQKSNLKKSDVYLCGYVSGTAPAFRSIQSVRNYFKDLSIENKP
jgi:hypothetical protein